MTCEYLTNETMPVWLACPSCGTHHNATACLACGHELTDDYAPALGLWASYRYYRRPWRDVAPAAHTLFPVRNRNSASQIALALSYYAFVPFLGLLFCPAAIICGVYGLWQSYRVPHKGGGQTAALSLLLGLSLSALQTILWRLFY